MKLLSFEQAILCSYIQSSEAQRKAIMEDVNNDPKSSGPLKIALRECSKY